MKKFLGSLLILCFYLSSSAQVLFEENFESGTLPPDWIIQSSATDGGWLVGAANQLSSQFFSIPNNGSGFIVATNDDACNCNKFTERLSLPPVNLETIDSYILKFDSYFLDNTYLNAQESASVEISLDGINWVTVEDVHGHGSWDTHAINLSDYAGNPSVYISFNYSDGGGWLYGFAVDNIKIEVPPRLDVSLVDLDDFGFGLLGSTYPLGGTVLNNGSDPITSLDMSYTINGTDTVNERIDGINVAPFSYYNFKLINTWTPPAIGAYDIEIDIEMVNDELETNTVDNTMSFLTEIFEHIVRPNIVQDIMNSNPDIIQIADSGNALDGPTDIDFFPILARDEIWVVNRRDENSGGSTLTISDASTSPNSFWTRVDGNAWHFMSLPTGIAFSDDNYNFATSPGVKDANHSGGTFTGPTLWSSDPAIYAQPSGGNGSHLDMLHGSPFSMGIAHEKDNVFWVYDDWNKDIVRYDFVDDHGPGNDDHSDAIVRRYKNIGITADAGIPNHMILDENSSWMYVVDNGNDRVLRIDINSGTPSITLNEINESLAEHSQVTGFTAETVIDEGLSQPCGIEIIENLLLVGEYLTGEIFVYDMDQNFIQLGTIETDIAGITGIKIGPDGSIWYTNFFTNTLNKIQVGMSTGADDISNLDHISIYPNPVSDDLYLSFPEELANQRVNITISELSGKTISTGVITNKETKIDVSALKTGMYILQLKTNNYNYTHNFQVVK